MFDLFLVYGIVLVGCFLAGLSFPFRLAGRVLAALVVLVATGGAIFLWELHLTRGDLPADFAFAALSFLLANVLFCVLGFFTGQALRWFCIVLVRAIRGEG